MGSSEHGFFQIDRSKGESVKETKTFPVSFFFTLTIFLSPKPNIFQGPLTLYYLIFFYPVCHPIILNVCPYPIQWH